MTRLVVFDYFRAVAILMIVAGHSLNHTWINSFGERFVANLIQGGTPLFVFISGFFFHHVFYQSFDLKTFLWKKSHNVLFPYLLLSGLALLYFVLSKTPLPDAELLGITSPDSWLEWLRMIGLYLWTGRTSFAYWYIPFIMLMFILSPLFVAYIRLSLPVRMVIFALFLLMSLLVHRPAANLSPWHEVLYFSSVYLLGILVSMHRETVQKAIHDKAWLFALIVLLLALLQTLFRDGFGNYHKADLFAYGGIDLLFLQKIALCFFWLSILQKLTTRYHDIVMLKLIAAGSFAIFFIHPWVLIVLIGHKKMPFLALLPWPLAFIIVLSLTVLISITLAWLVKRLIGKHSRSVIGW